ncbi:T9SS type A sorting domain-containing protein [Hymenobacter amundsenii]|uniref:T9SS type A sorting domain-containing protein n=1 Tax=Hymenobacter amundsenii TaxID=2006685 RepID=UPI0013FE153D|nr:T9SS type A sorting domain-containing protein [Hymenobacter amundsenii]
MNTNSLAISSNAPNNTTTTPGTSVTLTSTGGTAGSYTYTAFTNGVTTTVSGNGPSIMVNPLTTTRYTVTGPTAAGGCPSSAIVQIQVGNTPLPVGLTTFTATQTSQGAELRWATAFELNNNYFDIERSLDGAEFRSVGRVAGAGTTSGATTSYRFTDATPVPAGATAVYYRLRQVDFSGDATTSGVRIVSASSATNELAASVFPNPATDVATVRFVSAMAGPVTVEVRNVLGQLLLLKTVTVQSGLQEIVLPEAAAWSAGMHYLVLSQNQQRQVLRLNRR